ncbi:MAG: anthranilate synthase component I family protein [Candidatus Thorarchaeota archaeon]|nr:anthranilate synthase component I family protein [Candidatus Thorarchaeota archaeon]
MLRATNPSPYMFLLEFDETCLVGSSPEMLVKLEQDVLTTKPIAGTRPRSPNIEEDEKLKVELLLDDKERAEHVMLVDLHRNDLGRVAKYGTIKVDQFMNVEKFSHVQHIVSRVRGILRANCDQFDVLRAVFPAGTVTGAPKPRAMELIEQFESTRRGPYAGVVGHFDFNGNMDFAITIRSLVIKSDQVYVQAGAGIVADSIPEREFFETEHKMQAMIQALGGDVHE